MFADWVRGAPNQRTDKFNHIRVKLSRSMSEGVEKHWLIDYQSPAQVYAVKDQTMLYSTLRKKSILQEPLFVSK